MLDNIVYFNREKDTRALMSEAKFFESYSRWDEEKGRYETWEESVKRVMDMHRYFYKDKMTDELSKSIDFVESHYKQKNILGAQRALQFGGDQLLSHNLRLFNCTSSYADRAEFFGEYFYVLLCGAGCGVSVQKHHVNKIPNIKQRNKQSKVHVVTDDIEGWATSVDVLLSSFFENGGKHPEYEGRKIYFDTSKIRKKGAFISGGFKAPGPEPLISALNKIEQLINELISKGVDKLSPINVYDIGMFIADAVLSGGVRRSATIFLFSVDDEEMLHAKTGNWFEENPQRARSNNSAVILRSAAKKDDFIKIIESIKQFGEPGFVFVDSLEHCFNPCLEIAMYPQIDGSSGFQGCNLVEINGTKATSIEKFYELCEVSSILATLQAGYTNFKFLSETSKKIFDREALLGVSVTGWMNNPHILLNEDTLRAGARIVKDVNKSIAKIIGINPAARTCCCKPAGNASVLLQTASGVHGEHSPIYIRNVQMNKDTEVAKLIKKHNPYMVEESIWSPNKTDYVISFPVISPQNSIYRKDLYGINLLEKVKLIQQSWVEEGTDLDLCIDKTLRHNVSNTISVLPNQWEEVTNYLFDNKQYFTGVSLLSSTGDKDYFQAPYSEVMDESEVVDCFGRGAIFASGLIVDSSKGFDNLWAAITIAQQETDIGDIEKVDIRAEWVRKFKKYTENYFNGDTKKAEYCLKAVYLLHKWTKIQQNFNPIDFATMLGERKFTDIDTMGAVACVGGACAI